MKIQVEHNPKDGLPDDRFDYEAFDAESVEDGLDGEILFTGYGASERDAIADLIRQMEHSDAGN